MDVKTTWRLWTLVSLSVGLACVAACTQSDVAPTTVPTESGALTDESAVDQGSEDQGSDQPSHAVDGQSSENAEMSASMGQSIEDEPRELAEDRTSSDSKLAKGDINFDDLKFDIEKGEPFADSQLNDRVRSLNGRKVKLSGFILPASTYKQTGIEQFVLVRDNQECCFGPGASLFDCVFVKMVGGNTADFATRPVTVEGKFKIETDSYRYPDGVGPDGSSHLAVFEIEGVDVR